MIRPSLGASVDLLDFIYFGGRIVTSLLCAGAAALALHALAGRWTLETTPRVGLALLLMLLVVRSGLSILSGYDVTLHKGGRTITLVDWAWFALDFTVPLLAVYIVTLVRQRDRLLARLAALANSDPLTGLSNRRSFEALAVDAIRSCAAARRLVAILAFDIDRFKSINDTHGHATGDEVLVGVARVLLAGMRQNDVVGRIGGEEFAAILPNSDVLSAAAMADRLRGALTSGVRHPSGDQVPLTMSVGVALVPTNDEPQQALTRALAAADSALYAAKRNGRDRTEITILAE